VPNFILYRYSELLEFQEGPADSGEFFLPDSIKLGLGGGLYKLHAVDRRLVERRLVSNPIA
jgi:hypothetical protein